MNLQWIPLAVFLLALSGLTLGQSTPEGGLSLIQPAPAEKGSSLALSGTCAFPVALEGRYFATLVWSTEVDCTSNRFNADVMLENRFPVGRYEIRATSGNQSASRFVSVRANRNAQTVRVTPLSIPPEKIERSTSAESSVRATFNDRPVEGATGVVWGATALPLRLEERPNGVYAKRLAIDPGAMLGKIEVQWVVETADGLGGYYVQPLEIEPTTLLVRWASQSQTNWETGKAVIMEWSATYADGSPVRNGTSTLAVNDLTNDYALDDEGRAIAEWAFSSNEQGTQTIRVNARDEFGNEGTQTVFVSVHQTLSGIILENAIFIALAGIGVLALGGWLLPETLRRMRRDKWLARRKALELENERMQQEYFEKNAMDREAFARKSAESQKKMAEIDKELAKY